MGVKDYLEILPELWVSLMYLQCGSWLVYILYSFNMASEFYSVLTVWPQIIAVLCAICVGCLLTFWRVLRGSVVVFIYFFILLAGSILFLIAGILSISGTNYLPEMQGSTVMIGAIGHGLIYITGLCYIHIRTEGFRVARITLCHIFYLIGIATTAHSLHEFHADYVVDRPDGMWDYAHLPLGYHLLGYPALAIILVGLNFLMQGRMYDYKRLLDNKLSTADLKQDNFKSTLTAPIRQGSVSKMDTLNQLKLTGIMLLSKLKGGIFANNVFIAVAFVSQREIFLGSNDYNHIIHYFALLGLGIGFLMCFFVQLKLIMMISVIGYAVTLFIATILYSTESWVACAVFMWLFYMFISVSINIPDIGLMEVAPLGYYEVILSVGYAIEAIPLIAATYIANIQSPVSAGAVWINTSVLLIAVILVTIGMFFWYPDTLKKTVLDIQFMILYKDKSIVVRPAPPVNTITIDLEAAPKPYPEVTPVAPPVAPTTGNPPPPPPPPPIPTQPGTSTVAPPVHFNQQGNGNVPVIQAARVDPGPDIYQIASAPSQPTTPVYPELPVDQKPSS